MKKYGMREGGGQPEGSRPGIWKKRFPSCLLHHRSQSWLSALAVLLDFPRPPQAPALHGQQSQSQPTQEPSTGPSRSPPTQLPNQG